MKTIKLDKTPPSVAELLSIAREESLLLVAEDGHRFVLEEADDFEHELAQLGSSEKFMNFLKERSKDKPTMTIEQFAKELDSTKA